MPAWIRWMLVDSSGSMNPLDRPMATTLRFHMSLRRPVVNRRHWGSPSASPSKFAISVAAAAVDPTQPAWQGTLELALWTALLLTLAVVVWQTGLGTLLRRLFNLIPERKRSAAKLLREAVEHPDQIREAAAAIRTADPMINAAWKG